MHRSIYTKNRTGPRYARYVVTAQYVASAHYDGAWCVSVIRRHISAISKVFMHDELEDISISWSIPRLEIVFFERSLTRITLSHQRLDAAASVLSSSSWRCAHICACVLMRRAPEDEHCVQLHE